MTEQHGVESQLKDIKCRTRRRFSAEEKIRSVLEGIQRETMRKRRKENLRQTLKRTTPTRGLTTT